MSYQKLVVSGNTLEVYTYEYEPISKYKSPMERWVDFTFGDAFRSTPMYPRLIERTKQERNIQRAHKTFVRLVKANLYDTPQLLTLTYSENISDISRAWKDFTVFALSLRRRYPQIRYIVVPEFQKRGAVHFHCLLFNYPSEFICTGHFRNRFKNGVTLKSRYFKHDCPPDKACEKNTRFLAKRWGHGFCDLSPTDGSPKLAGYLAKYMSKAMSDSRLCGKKAFSSSRNCVRPVSISSIKMPIAVQTILDDFEVQDREAERVQIFTTKFLGDCLYQRFTR